MAPHSRRDALKLLGAGATAVVLSRADASTVTLDPLPDARYFSLTNVRLGAGPFLEAQKRDADYLLRLEPDRMLHNFHVNAGLTPKAPVYGGWESVEPWVWIRCHGHTLGHYLSACVSMFESTNDARFVERVDYIVDELAACQTKRGDGLVTAFPDNAAPLLDSLAGKEFAGVPWYTMHKVVAGLRDACVQLNHQKALGVVVRLADWIDKAAADVPEERMQKMLDREHGGMNEVLADLWGLTSDERYKRLAQRFCHRALLDPLAAGRDTLNGLHANTQIPKVVGFSRIHEMTGDPVYGRASDFFWRTVVAERSYATGGHGDVEHFFPTNEFVRRLGSAKTMETCCTHNMLRLTRSLYRKNPQASYFDYYERALFNGILASQDPDTGMMTYFQATRPGYVKLYHTPFDSFWCCTGSGMENHARYGDSIYARGTDSLCVNLFLASTFEWVERSVKVTQETRFPDADTTRITLDMQSPQQLNLSIRQPAWCPAMSLTVNGRNKTVSRKPGSYHRLNRRFRPGDVVEVRLPMSLHLEPLPNAPADSSMEWAALMYGPIVLAGRLGTAGITQGSQLIVNERESGNLLNEQVPIPRWSRPLSELVTATERSDPHNLRFIARGFEDGENVELIPWFRIAHERFNLYWQGKNSA
jgi:DUF1680 family protein